MAVSTLEFSVGKFTTRLYTVYVTAIVWCVLLLRFMDLQIIAVVIDPIKRQFGVSDTELGLLTGFAFSALYGGLGIPVGRVADTRNRVTILSIAVGLWSAMTAFCGLASTFTQLIAARIGVGIGESGGTGPAYSLISDYYPAEKRPSVFAVLNSSVPVAVFMGFMVGGFVNAHFGWRAAFCVVGLPGVLVAILVRLTIREPRVTCGTFSITNASATGFLVTLGDLWRKRAYRHLVLATSIFTMGAMGSGIWLPSFFIRVHHMPSAQVAVWLAFIYGGAGLAGVLLGGLITERVVERTGDARWYVRVPAVCSAAILPIAVFVYLWRDPIVALLAHIGTTALMHSWMGPAYGTIQNLAGAQRRGVASAVNMLAINLIAYGFGPLSVGMASDTLGRFVGDQSLRYSILAVVVITYAWAGIHFLLAARTIREELEIDSSEQALPRRLQDT